MGDPLEEYLAIYDDAAGRMFVALDAAIRQAAPELDVAIKYRLLSYTVDQDWRHRERTSCRVPPRACEWRGAGGPLTARRSPPRHVHADDLGHATGRPRRYSGCNELRPQRAGHPRPFPGQCRADQRCGESRRAYPLTRQWFVRAGEPQPARRPLIRSERAPIRRRGIPT